MLLTIKKQSFRILELILLLLVVLVFIYPFIWMISTAFKSFSEINIFPPKWIPERLMWENFKIAWNSGPFARYMLNSIVVVVGILVLQFLTIVPAAYAFTRFRFKGKKFLFGLTMAALMIPPQITFLPIYIQMSKLNLINSYIPLILPYATSAFGIFLLRQSFMQIPDEIIEAAVLDGAGDLQIMWQVMVGMSKPALVTFGLFSFIYHWNDYFWPLVMTNADTLRTLPIGIAMLRNHEGGVYWNIVMAGNMILVVPILIVFFFAQKQIINAFVYSGIK